MSDPHAASPETPQAKFSWKAALTGTAALIAIVAGVIPNVITICNFTCDRFHLFCPIQPPPKELPTVKEIKDVPHRYSNATVAFVRTGEQWTEIGADGKPHFHFITSVINDDYIYIIDKNRLRNNDADQPFTIRIPVHGGMSEWGYPNTFQWNDLYPVSPS